MNADEIKRNTHGGGRGVPDVETLVRRAEELARIDGRTEPNARDFIQARQELTTIGSVTASPEAGELENLTAWDTPLKAAGTQIAAHSSEDESRIAEKLTEEGIEEADHDQRLNATDPLGD